MKPKTFIEIHNFLKSFNSDPTLSHHVEGKHLCPVCPKHSICKAEMEKAILPEGGQMEDVIVELMLVQALIEGRLSGESVKDFIFSCLCPRCKKHQECPLLKEENLTIVTGKFVYREVAEA